MNPQAHIKADPALTLARQAVLAIIHLYTAMIAKALTDSKEVLRLSRLMAREIRVNMKSYHVIYQDFLREELARNPNLRRQVYDDLGGARAMIKWQARQRSARIGRQFHAARLAQGLGIPDNIPAEPRIKTANKSPRKPYRALTDRSGRYCLAVIPIGSYASELKLQTPTKAQKTIRKTRPIKRRIKSWRFNPVQVTPKELRPLPIAVNYNAQIVPATSLPCGNSPP